METIWLQLNTLVSTRNPLHGVTMGELLDKALKTTRTLRAKGHTVLEMRECHFKGIVKANLDVKCLLEGFG